MRVLPLLSSSSTGRWQLSWESLPDSFLFKAVLRGTLKGPPHTTSWENSIPLNNFFLFTKLYDIREHIGVFLYICWNHHHDNVLQFSTPTIFFYAHFQSNFYLYCSPPPLTPLILLTLTLTSNTLGMWTSLLFIFSPCSALQSWFKEIYVLHTLPWDKSQDNVKQKSHIYILSSVDAKRKDYQQFMGNIYLRYMKYGRIETTTMRVHV